MTQASEDPWEPIIRIHLVNFIEGMFCADTVIGAVRLYIEIKYSPAHSVYRLEGIEGGMYVGTTADL